jgi:hypothetical protein
VFFILPLLRAYYVTSNQHRMAPPQVPVEDLAGASLKLQTSEAPDGAITESYIKGGSLWESQPALVLVLRRPGCGEPLASLVVPKVMVLRSPTCASSLHLRLLSSISRRLQTSASTGFLFVPPTLITVLCRAEAQKLWQGRAQYEDLGMRMICVVHEWIEREIKVIGVCA